MRVVVKTVMLIVFVCIDITYIRRENLTLFIPHNTWDFGSFGWSGVLRGAAVMFFAYIGFDAVLTAAQEAKNPHRELPIGFLALLAICPVIYFAVAIYLLCIGLYLTLN